MSDDSGRARYEGRISLGNILTITTGIIAFAAAFSALQTDYRALAQRIDQNEKQDGETAKTLTAIKEALAEMRAEQRAVRLEAERVVRQLDRVADRLEMLARGATVPQPQQPPAPSFKPGNP